LTAGARHLADMRHYGAYYRAEQPGNPPWSAALE
jgi:hypothetical protein